MPRTLVYRDAQVILECVEDPELIAFNWAFRARKLAPRDGICVLARGVAEHRLYYTIRVEGFPCAPNSSEERIMEALVATGHAEKIHCRA